MWINVMNWFDKIMSGDIEKQPRYSIYSLRSKCIFIKADCPGYLERELMQYLHQPCFDGWLYEIDIVKGNKKKHLSLSNRKKLKEVVFISDIYFKY